jgi:NTP pyrophosphatase (non-canonical NTP hydrolase)
VKIPLALAILLLASCGEEEPPPTPTICLPVIRTPTQPSDCPQPTREDCMPDDLNNLLAASLREAQRAIAGGDQEHADALYESIKKLRKVGEERARQDERFGVPKERDYTWADWMLVLMEEVGEVAKAIQDGTRDEIMEEVVDVSAVALAMLEAMA